MLLKTALEPVTPGIVCRDPESLLDPGGQRIYKIKDINLEKWDRWMTVGGE